MPDAPASGSRLGRGLAGLVGLGQFGPTDEELIADHLDGIPGPGDETGSARASSGSTEVQDGEMLGVPVDQLRRNPYQPRKDFDAEAMKELADSIRQHGVLSPLLVRPDPTGGFQLIAGERRWLAARDAGLDVIPCQVRLYTDRQVYETAMEENLKREDLNPLEQAQAFRRYLDEFDSTIEQLSGRLSMSRSAVSNVLRLLELSVPVQEALWQEKITAGHARALLKLTEEQQLGLCTRIVEEGLTVRLTEAAARSLKNGGMVSTPAGTETETPSRPTATNEPPPLSNHLKQVQDQFRRLIGTRVEIRLTDAVSGKVVIPFADANEFQRVQRVLEQRRAA